MESNAVEPRSPNMAQSTPTPPPEYMLLTPALTTNYGGTSLNAVDLLQIHQTDFDSAGLRLNTTMDIQQEAMTQVGLLPEQFYSTLDGQFSKNGAEFNFAQFSPDNRVDSPNSQKSDQSNKSEAHDPFSPHCKIPLPTPYGPFEYWLEPSFIRRRNERERQRVRNVNEGFERLRNHLPLEGKEREKRLSKVETLRNAIDYIHDLKDLLREDDERKRRKMDNQTQRNSYQ